MAGKVCARARLRPSGGGPSHQQRGSSVAAARSAPHTGSERRVAALPSTTRRARARLRATQRRFRLLRKPTAPEPLQRTQLRITTSASLPCGTGAAQRR
jgi:hypothetical protein